MSLETNWIELNVSADGTATWRESGNVYQFSNLTAGVRVYTPYPKGTSGYINIKLPDSTVLSEKPMTWKENGGSGDVWEYEFGDFVTAITGMDYAAPLILAFRFVESTTGRSKTTNQVRIPIQPSVKGDGLYTDPDTAETLNAKIDAVAAGKATVLMARTQAEYDALTPKVGDYILAAVGVEVM